MQAHNKPGQKASFRCSQIDSLTAANNARGFHSPHHEKAKCIADPSRIMQMAPINSSRKMCFASRKLLNLHRASQLFATQYLPTVFVTQFFTTVFWERSQKPSFFIRAQDPRSAPCRCSKPALHNTPLRQRPHTSLHHVQSEGYGQDPNQ